MPEPRSVPRWTILACALAIQACASRPEPAATAPHPAAAPAEPPAHHHLSELPATAGPGFTVADVRFMQNMIGHHAQALWMAAMAPGRGASEGVIRLARKIDISQRDEIAMMRGWLAERRQAVPDDARAHAMTMPGMATAEQLTELDAARGREFDRLFLTLMIRHHEGALRMAEELFSTPGAGQDPDIFRFVTDVDADQRDEIWAMERLLDTLRD
jgi:uncharacterized protein (DUF305 family)